MQLRQRPKSHTSPKSEKCRRYRLSLLAGTKAWSAMAGCRQLAHAAKDSMMDSGDDVCGTITACRRTAKGRLMPRVKRQKPLCHGGPATDAAGLYGHDTKVVPGRLVRLSTPRGLMCCWSCWFSGKAVASCRNGLMTLEASRVSAEPMKSLFAATSHQFAVWGWRQGPPGSGLRAVGLCGEASFHIGSCKDAVRRKGPGCGVMASTQTYLRCSCLVSLGSSLTATVDRTVLPTSVRGRLEWRVWKCLVASKLQMAIWRNPRHRGLWFAVPQQRDVEVTDF